MTQLNDLRFDAPASDATLERAATALAEHGFGVEMLDDVVAARARVHQMIPPEASVLTSASETLRLSGIEADINDSGRYLAVRPTTLAMDLEQDADAIRSLRATPDVVIGSVHAVTETGSVVIASGSGSQLPACAGGAARAIWVVGSQKIVPNLQLAMRRVEEHCLPLESERAMAVYGSPSAISRLLIMNLEPFPGRATILLLREAIGF